MESELPQRTEKPRGFELNLSESDINQMIHSKEEVVAEQHPNVLRYIRVIRAFNENDLNTVKETCSENVVYRIAGRSPIAGEYRGIEQFGNALQLAKQLSGGTIAFKPKVILADDKHVMVYGRATANVNGMLWLLDFASYRLALATLK